MKRLFKKRKLKISLILIINVLVIYGYLNKYYLNSINDLSFQSLQYEKIVNAIRTNQPLALDVAEDFISCHKNIYGALVSLEVAKQYIDKNQIKKAILQLENGLLLSTDDNLKSIINLRLARIQIQQKNPNESLKILNSLKGEGFASIIADIQGEALLSKGDKQGARNAWEVGIKNNISPILNQIMQMKKNNLSF